MSSVDDRIVNMQFNNRQFSAGVTDSQRSLEGLDRTIANTAKGGGLDTLAAGVDSTSSRFNAMKVAGISAVATIASKATMAGLSLVKSLTLDPLTQGFSEYQTNLNSIQTIIANTGAPLKDVNKNLQQLNHYSDQTIYNFGQMASAIGKFTAAGVPLNDATSAIKGMANSAALSGADVNQLNSAMYQMSQALASGTIKLMDWNSLVNANMGGKNMQQSLIETAKTMGDAGAAMKDAGAETGSFRDSLQYGWLTADVFSKSMKVMAGTTNAAGKTVAYSVDQLKKMGYSDVAAKKLNKLSQAAIDSATKIKTIPQLIDVVKESIGSGWSKLFQDVFGDFTQSTAMWTKVGGVITTTIGNIFGSVDKMLLGWRKLGGYEELWASFGNIFKALGNIIHPFIAAFKAISPGTSQAGKGLYTVTHAIFLLTGWIEKATEGLDYLTPVFVLFGTVLGMVFKVVKNVARALGGQLAPIFDVLGQKLSMLVTQGQTVGESLIDGIIKGLDPKAIQASIIRFATSIIDWIKGALGIHSPSTEMIPVGYNIAAGIAEGLIKGIGAVFAGMGKLIGAIFSGVGKLFAGFDAMDFASLFNAILTGGLIYAVKKSVDALTTFRQIMGSIKGVIDEVGNSLKAWQQSLKAKMILEIAAAIAILVASLVVLSMIDPKKLAIGLGAIASLLGLLSGTLLALSKIESDKQMAILATSLLLISTAMVQLAAAILILGNQDLKTLGKGLGAMALILGILVFAMKGLAGLKGQFVGISAGMILIATAMNIMAGAVALLGNMDMKTLAKGLGAMAIGLALMVGALAALSVVGKNAVKSGAAIVLVATAINVMAGAIAILGSMDVKTLAKGLGAMAVGLILMVGALAVLGAGGPGMLAGAAGMVLMATAMNMMVGVILVLGTAPWQTVAKGLAFVAAGLLIFLAAGALAMAVAPGLEVLGSSMLMLGAAMFLAGTGMAAFGTGFALLAATGAAGTAVLIATIHAVLALLPEIAIQAAASMIAFVKVIANASTELRKQFDIIFRNILGVIQDNIPVIVKLVVTFVSALLKGITTLIPKFGKLISQLIKTGLDVLTKAIPQYISAGTQIITAVLRGLANNLPKMLNAAGDLVVAFIEGLGKQANKIIDAAGHTILKFLEGVDKAVVKYEDRIIGEGKSIAGHIVSGLFSGLTGAEAWAKIKAAVDKLTGWIPGGIKHILGIASPAKAMIPLGVAVGAGMAKGIVDSVSGVIKAVTDMANSVIAAGDKAVLKAQKHSRKVQNNAYRAQAVADLKARKAQDAQHYANQHKKDKEAQKRAKALQKQADQAASHASRIQAAADRAAQHVQDVQAFREADLTGKGDIKNEQAVALADRANKLMEKANAEADRARELMKTNHKAGQAMLDQSRKDAKAAQDLAKQAKQAHKDANRYYAQQVDDRIKQIKQDQADAEQERKDQAAYDAADAQGKSDILTKRAEAEDAKAKAAKALAEKLMAQAKKMAKTDAAKANELLDRAEQAAQDAQDAADQAAQDRADAQSVLTDGTTTTPTTGGTPGVNILPSRTALEDAAKAIDRYTSSLQEAEALAGAAQAPVQFIQNNNSPEALSASEIYRQSKNLLSAAELKMGVKANN